MTDFGASRRRLITARGRTMVLRRTATPPVPAVSFLAVERAFAPGELTGGIQQGDSRLEILADELLAAGFPLPPKNPDRVTVDGRTYTIMGARGLYDSGALIGYSLWARGG